MGFSFMPQDKKFFDLLEALTLKIVEASSILKTMINNSQNPQEEAEKIKEIETEGDLILSEIKEKLFKSMITPPPLEREDVDLLAEGLDNVLDMIEKTARDLVIRGIDVPDQKTQREVDLICANVLVVKGLIFSLKEKGFKKNFRQECKISHNLEDETDSVKTEALLELFSPFRDLPLLKAQIQRGVIDNNEKVQNILEILIQCCESIRWKDIYEDLERTTDRCEDVAKIVEAIMLKWGA